MKKHQIKNADQTLGTVHTISGFKAYGIQLFKHPTRMMVV